MLYLFKRKGDVQFIPEATSGWGRATVLDHEIYERRGGTTGREWDFGFHDKRRYFDYSRALSTSGDVK